VSRITGASERSPFLKPEPRRPISRRRALVELLVVVPALLLIVGLAPLNSPYFPVVSVGSSVVLAGYMIVRLVRRPDEAVRWRLLLPREVESCREGCLSAGYLTLAGLLPAAAVRWGVAAPTAPDAASYLLWCAVQDFLFFALIQRNLEDLVHPAAAVTVAAGLFGLSHYPFEAFMAVSAAAGAAWGWLYRRTGSLLPVLGCHWLMGLQVLN
jgi:membrane protease YdiL (CAAX protease family)